MPFTPGHRLSVGNRGGRPKRTPEASDAQTLARKYTKEAIDGLLELARHAEEANVRARCWETLLARGWGKEAQAVQVSGPDGGPITISWLESADTL